MTFSTDLFLEYKRRPGRGALARLLESHQDALYTLCYQVLRHPQDAEDACQEVLLEVSRQVDSVQEPERFSAWLYRTALHTALDVKRKRGRQRVRDAGATRAPGAEPRPPEAIEALHRGLAGLDDSSRTLVVEHYFARRPLRELAAERGCSEVAVWKRIRNAKERLKKSLGSAAVSALEGFSNVPAPAALLQKGLGLSGGLAMAMKVGVKLAIVLPLLLLAGGGAVLVVRQSDPPPPEMTAVPKPDSASSAKRVPSAPPQAPAAPASPALRIEPRPRKPYPFKDPAVGQPAAAVRTWTILSTTRVTLDIQNETLPGILKELRAATGLTFVLPGGSEREMISFKVQDIVVDGALRLMLQPRMKNYEILSDGTVRIDAEERLEGGYEKIARQASSHVQDLHDVRQQMDKGWDGLARNDAGALLDATLRSRTIVATQGETTLDQEIRRLWQMGVCVYVEHSGVEAGITREQEGVLKKPFMQVVGERTLAAHLEDLARARGLVSIPMHGTVIFTTEDSAEFYREQADKPRKEHEMLLANFRKPVEPTASSDISEFLDSIGRSHGLTVVPSEEAWNSGTVLALPAGTTLQQALDQLRTQGLRWAVRDGKLYVLR